MALSPDDEEHLATLEGKIQIIRDRTRGVACGYRTGMYLWGEGGIGKSYAVISTLDTLKADYLLSNSRLTGRGLFDLLMEYPTKLHLLEDCEPFFGDKNALGVLRSALWGQTDAEHRQVRWVTWRTFWAVLSFDFEGGIIMIGNRSLETVPELKAVQSRIPTMQLTATNAELAALMRSVSEEGFRLLLQQRGLRSMSPAHCQEVCEFLIAEILPLARNLDMRLLVNAFRDYLQFQDGETGTTHWKDLVRSELTRQATVPESRAERLARERQVVLEIAAVPGLTAAERERRFHELTGTSGRGFRRRLEEARR
jgi:hypothetical protein